MARNRPFYGIVEGSVFVYHEIVKGGRNPWTSSRLWTSAAMTWSALTRWSRSFRPERKMNMAWIDWNPSPTGRRVGDCSVRAVARALGVDWETAYIKIAAAGYAMGDMPSSDSVWGAVLRQNGFYRKAIPNTCPDCYTVSDFAQEHPVGVFVLALGGHVVTVEDGDWYDTWNSANEVPQYYWHLREED